MPDDFDRSPGIEPGAALRALPPLTPPHDAWLRLRARLPERRARMHPGWYALAATLLLALLLPAWLAPTSTPAPPQTAAQDPGAAAGGANANLQQLMLESAQLEAFVSFSRDEQVESATAASLAVALQSRIEHIDALLARSDLNPSARLPLWQERVLRLRELAGLESTQQLLAANGDADQGVPVLAF
jgi:hypothetical protein